MFKAFKRSFFRKLFLYFLIISVLLTFLTGVLIVLQSSSLILGDIRQQTQRGVSSAAQEVDMLLTRSADSLLLLAQDQTIKDYLSGQKNVSRYDVARIAYLSSSTHPAGVSFHIIRLMDGEIVSTGHVSPIFEKENYNPHLTIFRRFAEASDVGVYTTVRGINMIRDTRIILGKAIDTRENKEPQGFVICEVSRQALAHSVSGFAYINNQPYLITDPYDVVVFNSLDEKQEGLNKLNFSTDFSAFWQAETPCGIDEKENLVYNRMNYASYLVVSQLSLDLINAVYSAGFPAVPPVIAAIFLVSVLFAYLAARHVSLPVERLTLAMQKVEKGNFKAQVPVKSKDEIGRLSEAFNRMQSQIEELIKRNEEKQKSLRVAEVKALSLQVNPHFLYNTLDMIKWSVKLDQKEKANQIIVQFGRLLRQLMNTTEDFLPLEDELKLVNAYLSIQMLRHQGRFKVETDIEPDLLPVMIPKLMLQPLVENAIIHGLESKASDGKLIIRVRSEGENYVCLTVADNGQGMDEKQLETVRALVPDGIYHIGLSNLHQRAKLFGDEHCGLTIKSKVMQGTEISLIIKRTENQGGEYHRDV